MDKRLYAMDEVNLLSPEEFVRLIGPVFEHSPWVSENVLALRPFATMTDLHRALCDAVLLGGEDKQLDLIRAHPDLVGRAARQNNLTAESAREQASAGLEKLTIEEITLFQNLNAAYRKKFGFPFVICARLNKKEAIITGFQSRLENSIEAETKTALLEIFKIADLRLQELISRKTEIR